jgi:hypothetical protein
VVLVLVLVLMTDYYCCGCLQDAERLCDKIIERNASLLGPDHVCRTQVTLNMYLHMYECLINQRVL